MFSAMRFGKLVSKLTLLGTALFFAVPLANADVYSLGDSLSDAGSLGFTYTNPATLSPLTSGKVWVQHLTSSVPAFCNDPKHCLLNNDTFYYTNPGNNYAVGGAGVTFDSTDAKVKKNYTDLHSQIYALLHSRVLNKNDIITVWMGANDIFAAAQNRLHSYADVANAARVFQTEIINLAIQVNGASIYVISIPDLGKTPLGLNTSDGGKLLSELTVVFNLGISGMNVHNVSLIDSNAGFNQLYGQLDTSMIYCSVIIDPKHVCGDPKTNPEYFDPAAKPFLFADPVHPSNAAHQYIANQLQLTKIFADRQQ
jgi:outer membrane lipase/esterase